MSLTIDIQSSDCSSDVIEWSISEIHLYWKQTSVWSLGDNAEWILSLTQLEVLWGIQILETMLKFRICKSSFNWKHSGNTDTTPHGNSCLSVSVCGQEVDYWKSIFVKIESSQSFSLVQTFSLLVYLCRPYEISPYIYIFWIISYYYY